MLSNNLSQTKIISCKTDRTAPEHSTRVTNCFCRGVVTSQHYGEVCFVFSLRAEIRDFMLSCESGRPVQRDSGMRCSRGVYAQKEPNGNPAESAYHRIRYLSAYSLVQTHESLLLLQHCTPAPKVQLARWSTCSDGETEGLVNNQDFPESHSTPNPPVYRISASS